MNNDHAAQLACKDRLIDHLTAERDSLRADAARHARNLEQAAPLIASFYANLECSTAADEWAKGTTSAAERKTATNKRTQHAAKAAELRAQVQALTGLHLRG